MREKVKKNENLGLIIFRVFLQTLSCLKESFSYLNAVIN